MFRFDVLIMAAVILLVCFIFAWALNRAMKKASFKDKNRWQKTNIVCSYIVIVVVGIGSIIAILRQIMFIF